MEFGLLGFTWVLISLLATYYPLAKSPDPPSRVTQTLNRGPLEGSPGISESHRRCFVDTWIGSAPLATV